MGLTFQCTYCNHKPFPNFKRLVLHYWEFHAERKKRYEVKLKDRTSVALVYATTLEEAAYAAGWDEKDCNIKEINECPH